MLFDLFSLCVCRQSCSEVSFYGFVVIPAKGVFKGGGGSGDLTPPPPEIFRFFFEK